MLNVYKHILTTYVKYNMFTQHIIWISLIRSVQIPEHWPPLIFNADPSSHTDLLKLHPLSEAFVSVPSFLLNLGFFVITFRVWSSRAIPPSFLTLYCSSIGYSTSSHASTNNSQTMFFMILLCPQLFCGCRKK